MPSLIPSGVAGLLLAAGVAAAQTPPANSWRATGLPTGEYVVSVDSTVAHGGRRSARIEGFASAPSGVASVSDPIRAGAYRGKRVKLSAYVKTRDVTGPGAWISLGVVVGPGVVAQGTSERSAVKGTTDWQLVTAVVDVHEHAVGLWASATLNGRGTVWVDDFTIEPAGDAVFAVPLPPPVGNTAQAQSLSTFFASLPEGAHDFDFESASITAMPRSPLEAPRALTSRGLDNLLAFARLAGVVRHFHPTEAVRTTNWDDFLVRGVRVVERAPTADSLARTLTTLFASVAPSVRVVAGSSVAVAPAAPPNLGDRTAVAYWNNVGLVLATNTANQNIYSSSLTISPAPDGRLPAGVPHPDSVWRAPLAGGVSAVVPVALWVELPSSETERRKSPLAPFAREAVSSNDRATRLVGVITTWNVFQHSYPYFDIVRVDWNAELSRALKSAATTATPADHLATLRRLVAAAADGHGNVVSFAPTARRAYLPVALDWVENQLVVTRVAAGATPDIKRGDVIESVDGIRTELALTTREEVISSATPQWRRYRAVTEVVFGDSGAVRAFRLKSGRDVRLSFTQMAPITDDRPEKIGEVRPGIMYVDISRITDADFNNALPELHKARGVVFDMRGYPRTVNTANILARLSTDTIRSAHFEVPTYTRPDQQLARWDRDGAWRLPPIGPKIPGKIAFLTGGGAISYAESTMGIVEQYRLGEIVGATTAGTNGNVNPFPVIGGYQVMYTGMRVRKRDNTPHHGVGIKPTIPVPRTIRGVTDGRDEPLERAIAVVSGSATIP